MRKTKNMYLGKALRVCISGFDKQSVIDGAKEYCNKNGYKIWVDVYKEFRLFKWKWEYIIELYKPIDFEVIKTPKADNLKKEGVELSEELKRTYIRETMKDVIVSGGGYDRQQYGYVRVTSHNLHWITLFEDGTLQMYAYLIGDAECKKIYDTGIISVSDAELQTLINVVIQNHF